MTSTVLTALAIATTAFVSGAAFAETWTRRSMREERGPERGPERGRTNPPPD